MDAASLSRGPPLGEVEVPSGSDLEKSVKERATNFDGAKWSIDSYAPSVVVETELRRANFGNGIVVIESRKSAKSIWTQRVRKSTKEDLDLRKKLLAYFDEQTADD